MSDTEEEEPELEENVKLKLEYIRAVDNKDRARVIEVIERMQPDDLRLNFFTARMCKYHLSILIAFIRKLPNEPQMVYWAVRCRDNIFLQWLVTHGYDPNENDVNHDSGQTPIVHAPLTEMQILINNGANVNARDGVNGSTVLNSNISLLDCLDNQNDPELNNHVERIRLLLRHGADVYAKISNSYDDSVHSVLELTPLKYQPFFERVGVIPILLQPILIPRLGTYSPLRMLTSDLIHHLATFIA